MTKEDLNPRIKEMSLLPLERVNQGDWPSIKGNVSLREGLSLFLLFDSRTRCFGRDFLLELVGFL